MLPACICTIIADCWANQTCKIREEISGRLPPVMRLVACPTAQCAAAQHGERKVLAIQPHTRRDHAPSFRANDDELSQMRAVQKKGPKPRGAAWGSGITA